ncbi:VOC family protein [Microbacteriaceae bacterium VKM Ac-2854]|nr:VOC family protein [Microbacteriaceae bacterium VKM Ac-2854]
MRIELIPLRCTDVDRGIAFYVDQLGFALDHDVRPGNGMRIVQLTPPGSACSIVIGTGMSDPDGPAVHGIHLVVDDLDAVRSSLLSRGVEVSGITDMGGGVRYAYFADPDDNSWALQEIRRAG